MSGSRFVDVRRRLDVEPILVELGIAPALDTSSGPVHSRRLHPDERTLEMTHTDFDALRHTGTTRSDVELVAKASGRDYAIPERLFGHAISRVDDDLSTTNELIDLLYARLESVLAPDMSVSAIGEGVDPSRPPLNATLVENVDQRAEILEQYNGRLVRLIDRISL